MAQAFYFIGCIFLFLGSIWSGYNIFELVQKSKNDKYQTNKNWFVAILYKVQMQCISIGEFEYAKSISNLIEFYTTPKEEKKISLTNDGASTEAMLNRNKIDEMKKAFEELKEEFIG